ncbi:MAG TPA: LysR family transcriptional regulator [Stellaceae bacterium]|nr:LysR family transcriptional regulator [Stellaceae bacterium]
MDLRQLDHFVAVAEEHNFTRAARRVHIVQSALSTSIRGLEKELGTPLFRRNARNVTLTHAGEIMLDRARRVLKDVRDVREAVAGVDGRIAGTLSLCTGLIQCLNPYLDVIDLLARFHDKHPGVHIRLRQMPTEPSLDELRSDQAEIALVALPQPLPAGFNASCVARDKLAFICRREHACANLGKIEVVDLSSETFIDLTRPWLIRRRVDDYCRHAKLERRISCEVNELATLFDLVRVGLGVAIAPLRLARQYEGDIAIIELSPASLPFDYGAIVAVDRTTGTARLNAPARAFLAMIEQSAGDTSNKEGNR